MATAEELNKLLETVKQAKSQGFSAQEVEDFLQRHGSSMYEMGAVNQYGAENIAKARQTVSEAKENTPSHTAEVIGAGLKGFGEGALTATEAGLNVATLGGYDWLNDKIGGSAKERRADVLQTAEDAGLKTPAKVALTITEIASALASPVNKLMPSGATTTLGKIGQGALTGSIYGGVSSGFGSDFDIADTLRGAGIGAGIGGIIPAVIEGGKKIGSSVLGFITGTNQKAVEQAAQAGQRNSKDFLSSMRGKTDELEVVETANKYVEDMRKNASKVLNAGKDAIGNKKVNFKPIVDTVSDTASKMNYNGVNIASEGEQKVFNKVVSLVDDYMAHPKAQTITGADELKQAIGKISVPMEDNAAMALRTRLYNAVKNSINKAAPEYETLMGQYSDAATIVNNLDKELSTNAKNVYTTLGKLQSAMRNNAGTRYGARSAAIEKLGDTAAKKILDMVAGQSFNTIMPRGFAGQIAGATGVTSLFTNPALLSALPATSPRLVGELAYKIGQMSNYAPSLSQALSAGALLKNE